MKQLFKPQTFALGFAIFSMFFGAGNVIYPLAIGQYAGDQTLFATGGFLLSAILMPIAGLIAMLLYEGNTREFFGRMGRVPGFILALITITLLGPLGSTPRCIILAYTTLKSVFPDLSHLWFSLGSCGLIFLLTVRRNHLLTLLGWILAPALLISLIAIVSIGLFSIHEIQSIDISKETLFLSGLKEGYNTMDLLAAFFFSSTILALLKTRKNGEAIPKKTQNLEFCQSQRSRFDPIEAAPIQMDRSDAEGVKDGDADTGKNQVLSFLGYNSKLFKTAFYGSMIGAILLGAIYTGFSLLAAFHGGALESVEKGELLARITLNILGPQGGLLVCLTITLVCLTTAIALISSFADFIRNEVFQNKLGYEMVLASSLLLTFFVSIFDFSAISSFLEPILEICYPGLILLTGLNLAYRLKNFRPVKLPVYMVFSLSLLFHFLR